MCELCDKKEEREKTFNYCYSVVKFTKQLVAQLFCAGHFVTIFSKLLRKIAKYKDYADANALIKVQLTWEL